MQMEGGAVISFTVPGEPQGKGRAKFGNGRTYTPEKTVAYEGLIALAGERAMAGAEPMLGPVSLSFTAVYSIPARLPKKRREAMLSGAVVPTKKPDLDNIAKAIGDGLNGVVFKDDAQIAELRSVRKIYGATPGLIVEVRPINFQSQRAA